MKLVSASFGSALLAGSLVLGLAAAMPVAAARAKRVQKTIPLFATAEGVAARLKGKARIDIRPDRNREKINVEVESSAAAMAGAELVVWVVNPTNSADPVEVGTLTLVKSPRRRNEFKGALELKNYDQDNLPTNAAPIQGITQYLVTAKDDATKVLLTNVNSGGNTPGSGGGSLKVGKRKIALVPTSLGASTRSKGSSEIEVRADGRQKFKIEVESDRLAAGTEVELQFSHAENGATLPAGPLTLEARKGEVEGEVEFDSVEGPELPAGASPVNKITSVTVLVDGQVLLVGTF